MKNKFKAAGVLNVLIGALCLLIVIALQGIFFLLYLSEGMEGFLIFGLIFGIPMLIVLSPIIAYGIFLIVMGVKMISKEEKKTSALKTVFWINTVFKLAIALETVYASYQIWQSEGESLGTMIIVALMIGGLPLLSSLMDIGALLKKEA